MVGKSGSTATLQVFAVFAALIFLSGFSTAQEENKTATETEKPVELVFDSNTRLLSYNWSDSGVTLVFESDMPRVATVTDVNSIPKSGAGEVNFKRKNLGMGKTVVNMDTVSSRGSMTVTIGVGDTLTAVSNPTEPLFNNITRSLFYIGLFLSVVSVPMQIMARQKLDEYLLKKDLVEV